MSGFPAKLLAGLRALVPTRELLEHNRWVRPFAHLVLRPELWSFNRRSVPRGVALGLFAGILIPFAHSAIAAVSAVFTRANVPVAVATTWSSNPGTWALIFPGAIFVSRRFGFHVDMAAFETLRSHDASLRQWAGWLVSDAAPALLFGLFVLATVISALGYVITSFVWRWRVGRKRRTRLAAAAARAATRATAG